jgi:hypothetical protein
MNLDMTFATMNEKELKKSSAKSSPASSTGQRLIKTDVELFAAIRQNYESMKRKGLFPYSYKPTILT